MNEVPGKEREFTNLSKTGGKIKAMLFAAGLGTRFKPWTDKHPKALAVINGKTLLQRNIEYLQQYNIRDVVVNVHHFAEQITTAIKENNGWGSSIIISDESDEVLETGGGLLKAKTYLNDSRFITLNVDILTDANLDALLDTHVRQKALITLAIKERDTSRYFLFNNQQRLCGWRNTVTGVERIAIPDVNLSEKAYSGMAVFEPAIFGLMTMKGKFSLVDVYLALAKDHIITGYEHNESKLLDVGKPESVAIAEKMFT